MAEAIVQGIVGGVFSLISVALAHFLRERSRLRRKTSAPYPNSVKTSGSPAFLDLSARLKSLSDSPIFGTAIIGLFGVGVSLLLIFGSDPGPDHTFPLAKAGIGIMLAGVVLLLLNGVLRVLSGYLFLFGRR